MEHKNQQLHMRLWVLTTILVFVTHFSFSQNSYKKISFLDVFEKALVVTPDSTVKFENFEIEDDPNIQFKYGDSSRASRSDLNRYLIERFGSLYDLKLDSGRVVIHNKLTFVGCFFRGFPIINISFSKKIRISKSKSEMNLMFENSRIPILELNDFEGDVSLDRMKVDFLTVSTSKGMSIRESEIGQANISTSNVSWIEIFSSTFRTGSKYVSEYGSRVHSVTHEDSLNNVLKSQVVFNDFRSLQVASLEGATLIMSNCKFLSGDKNGLVSITGSYDKLEIEKSYFENALIFNSCKVNEHVSLRDNNFKGGLSVKDIEFPSTRNFFNWGEFTDRKIFIPIEIMDTVNSNNHRTFYSDFFAYKQNKYVQLYRGASSKEISQKYDYEDLIDSYQKLYTIFRQRGDTESANQCYAEMKDIQTGRLKYLYNEAPSFNTYFRWRLASLMKFYTNHGTDPAKAITVSFWTIVLFGVFYFFFPSDWDITSKSELVKKFRTFIQKNENGYIKPFLSLIVGFSLSVINAFTLSLNSFTTLGFGNIPTHGIARYVCILQGFIGWFLLSIFTVALINQVLS